MARLDELGAKRPHGRVLLHRIALRHDDGGGNAGLGRGKRDALAMIAARGADHSLHTGGVVLELVNIDQSAAHLEGADRRVVLVLHPGLAPSAPGEQRPSILRRGRHGGVHNGGRVFDILQRQQHHATLG